MTVVGIILLILLALSLISSFVMGLKQLMDRRRPHPRQFEPDIRLVNQPNLIAKVPENENRIPDANASTDAAEGSKSRGEKKPFRKIG